MKQAVLLAALAALGVHAQKLDPIQWGLSLDAAKAPPGARLPGKLAVTMEPGWHLYSLTTPRPPIATTIKAADSPVVAGARIYKAAPVRKLDPNFNSDTETYEGKTVFLVEIELKKDAPPGPAEAAVEVRYQACNDKLCLNPKRKTVTAALSVDPAAPAPPPLVVSAGYSLFAPEAAGSPAAAPVQPVSSRSTQDAQSLGAFLLVAFGFGLAAVFTPCVFPMIPITMSFFANRKGGVVQAGVFCLGIIVLFSALGLITTAILGPFGVVQLGSSPWVNGFIALVFLAFGLSLLGAFEITLPSGLLTKLDQASQKGGIFGTLLMGLTFALTSFACVGPFMGTLLAASVSTGGARPLLGMASFAGGLALPFFLLALFPSYLQRLPRSGGWLPRVKTVMGFIVLAFLFKYLSNVDQVMQWGILTRERFLAAWVVLFALPGFYLLGRLRLEGIKPEEPIGVSRLLVACAFLIFSLSLVPGMFGVRLGEIEAFLPAPSAGMSAAAGAETTPWMKNQYKEALARARQENKLVFVAFTGYACTNCHWMKANMFPKPEIGDALKGFVLVELYTDGTDDASRANQDLQEKKFASVAIPFYAIVDPDEKVIASYAGLTKNTREFLVFLQTRPHA